MMLFLILTQQPALALDCIDTPTVWPSLWTGEANLPVNTVPMVYYSISNIEESPFFLTLSESSENIATDVIEIGDSAYHFKPQADLQSDSEYVFGPANDDIVFDKAYFSTTTGRDEDIPSTPVLLDISRSTEVDGWGTWDYLVFSFEDQGDGVQYHSFEFADNPEFTDSYTRWELPNSDNTYSLGNDPACTNELSSAAMDNPLHIRVTAYDAAGHASAPVTVDYQPETDSQGGEEPEESETEKAEVGCSSVPISQLGFWCCLSLVGLCRRDRKDDI